MTSLHLLFYYTLTTGGDHMCDLHVSATDVIAERDKSCHLYTENMEKICWSEERAEEKGTILYHVCTFMSLVFIVGYTS